MRPDDDAVLNTVTEHGEGLLGRLLIALGLLNLVYPGAVFVYAAMVERPYWRYFTAEGNFTAWWSSVQLLLIAGLVYVLHRFRVLSVRAGLLEDQGRGWIWPVVAAGFLLFAIDERFNFHEWLREKIFEPMGLFEGSAYVIDGDVGLYLFFLLGLLALPVLLRELESSPVSRTFLIAALVLTAPVVVIDSLRTSALQHLPYWRFWDYPFEEVGEVWAQWLFLAAFATLLRTWLRRWRCESGDAA